MRRDVVAMSPVARPRRAKNTTESVRVRVGVERSVRCVSHSPKVRENKYDKNETEENKKIKIETY